MQCYAFAVLCAMLMQELGRCAMLRVATCCARLWQRLRLLVQRYATLFYAMLCYAKARARRCRGFSLGCTGIQMYPQLQLQLRATTIGS
jgi:hypothetical protein